MLVGLLHSQSIKFHTLEVLWPNRKPFLRYGLSFFCLHFHTFSKSQIVGGKKKTKVDILRPQFGLKKITLNHQKRHAEQD